jgi:hypothetical protein
MILAAGNTPVAAGTTNVTVSWTASDLGPSATGYEVRVYDAASGTPRTITTACAGLVTTTRCIEATAPNGTWRYTIIPRQHSWSGAESPRSDPVTVGT